MRILVTGGTGYIGGRLVPRLLDQGHELTLLVRDPARVRLRPWAQRVRLVQGDPHRSVGLDEAMRDAQGRPLDAAYYLIHSMGQSGDFVERDREAARRFARAAADAGIGHVIYLGGLQPQDAPPSKHLASRAEVGAILAEHVPTTEFRAGPIIGSGSASFEMVRYLTERLPAMIAPKWIHTTVQPVAVRDVLSYLVAALEIEPAGVVEIGADRLTFKQMMLRYAEVRGLSRLIVPVPVLAPALAARWVGLVTPISNALAVPLVRGILHPLHARTEKAERLFPDVRPLPYKQAVELALQRVGANTVETRWSGALGAAPSHELQDREGMIREIRTRRVNAPPERVFETFSGLGGRTGWLVYGWAWEARGILDQFVGGPGLRRGRRHAVELFPGEAVDFWRVEAVDPPRLLRLRAEMKVPGKAWLQFEAIPENGASQLVQTALFDPKGAFGLAYWYVLYPLHTLIFAAMSRAIAERAEAGADSASSRHEAASHDEADGKTLAVEPRSAPLPATPSGSGRLPSAATSTTDD